MKEQLEKEKAALEAKNKELEKQIAEAQHTIYWNKKRIKLAEGQIKELPESDGETLKEIAEGLK